MISYDNALDQLDNDIKVLVKQQKILRCIQPDTVYLLKDYFDVSALVRIKCYRTYDMIHRNKIIVEILAHNKNGYITNGVGAGLTILLSFLDGDPYSMIPVSEKEFPLYVGMKYKTARFECMLSKKKYCPPSVYRR